MSHKDEVLAKYPEAEAICGERSRLWHIQVCGGYRLAQCCNTEYEVWKTAERNMTLIHANAASRLKDNTEEGK